ncbi:MAG: hypothetical protein HC860_24680, partial [Alkalinema sp. RU_4_3]|nr:hypothetical protein [Alkalinema sp. RU_4_3]
DRLYGSSGFGSNDCVPGFLARIFQHEYDHFQGILFPDRVESPEHLISEAAYQEMIQNPSPKFSHPSRPVKSDRAVASQ